MVYYYLSFTEDDHSMCLPFVHVCFALIHMLIMTTYTYACLKCIDGHVMCSPCRGKLEATGNAKCHVCREEIDSDDSRPVPCHGASGGVHPRPVPERRLRLHR